MRKQYTIPEWHKALEHDPGLSGISPIDAAEVLSLTEHEISELMLKGELNVSALMVGKEVFSVVIPERDVQRYDAKRDPS
jgi:hypothetical protein